MKLLKKIVVVLIFNSLIVVSPILGFYYYSFGDDYDEYDSYNNYNNSNSIIVNNMNFDMSVNENHSYNIKINEEVTFNTYYHGIYRSIARRGTYYREVDGKETATPYYAIIDNVKVESGQPYNIETDGDAYIIKIGDADDYVIGKQYYSYSYSYDPGDDGISSFDDVYQNIISQYQENPIEHLNITINMPKDFDSNNVLFFNGEYGSTESNLINYSVNGKQIKAESTGTINPGEVVTIRIALPEGYFQNIFTGKEYLPIYFIISFITLILGLLIYFLIGKNKKPLEPVTFYPPDNLDSAQVAYILKNHSNNNMLVSLLIYFADKGWLTIENLSASKNHPQYLVNRVENIPINRPSFEQTIFNAIFRKSDHPELNDLIGKRYMGNAFINAKEELNNWFSGNNSIISPKTYTSKTLILLLIVINSISCGVITSFLIFRQIDFFLVILLTIASGIGAIILNFGTEKSSFITAIGFTLIAAFGIILLTHSILVTAITLIINLVLGFLGFLSLKRTEKGNRWYGECKAFKHFIQTAELPRLKLLVEENPEYYYNILPYAYAMGLTDKWAKNFEGIALTPPDWYIDPYMNFQLFRTLYFMNMFNRGIVKNVNHINTAALRSMGSGGFGRGFGGGGFGGGGFGGGGAGGMGGGGW